MTEPQNTKNDEKTYQDKTAPLFDFLTKSGIETTTQRHPPLFTVEESQQLRGQIPGAHIKNLFLKNKKGKFWLIVAQEDTPIQLKPLGKAISAGNLSFAKAEYLREKLGVEPGSVTPLALINDPEQDVTVILDQALLEAEIINCHPLVNTATTSVKRNDLLHFIKLCGHDAKIVNLNEIEQPKTET